MRCQSGERLSPTSPNTQEKSIPRSLPQYPADSADVLYCIHEKHKLQLWSVNLIVLIQVILNHNLQLWAETVNCGYQIKAIMRGWVVVCEHSQASGRAEPGAQQGLGAAASLSCSLGADDSLFALCSYRNCHWSGLNLASGGGSSCPMVTLNSGK